MTLKPDDFVVLPSENTMQGHKRNRKKRLVITIRIEIQLFSNYREPTATIARMRLGVIFESTRRSA